MSEIQGSNEPTENPENENETTTVVFNTSQPVTLEMVGVSFFQEDVSQFCDEDGQTECNNKPTYVNREDSQDAICTVHRMELSPRARRGYIKIELVPSNKPTLGDKLFGDDEPAEEDFILGDDEGASNGTMGSFVPED